MLVCVVCKRQRCHILTFLRQRQTYPPQIPRTTKNEPSLVGLLVGFLNRTQHCDERFDRWFFFLSWPYTDQNVDRGIVSGNRCTTARYQVGQLECHLGIKSSCTDGPKRCRGLRFQRFESRYHARHSRPGGRYFTYIVNSSTGRASWL